MDESGRKPADVSTAIRGTSAQDVVIDQTLKNKRARATVVVAVSVLAGAFLLGVSVVRSWSESAVVVSGERLRIATVTRGAFINDVVAQGVIIAANSSVLVAPATGIATLHVASGERVTKGHVLAVIDAPSLKNEYERERASLDAMNLSLERQQIEIRRQLLQNKQASDQASVAIRAAEREFMRSESAWQQGVIARRDFDKARDELDAAKLIHEHALGNASLQDEALNFEIKSRRLERDRQKLLLSNLLRRVNDLTIKSPVDGVVGSISVTQKAMVAENAPVVTVVDLSTLEIEFKVPESAAAGLSVGMTAEVGYGAERHAGVVTSISPEVLQSEVLGRVRFTNERPQGLRQNQRVSVRIVKDSRDSVLKVERGAFAESGGVAYVVSGDIAVRRPVRLGAMSVGEVEVLSGLELGEQVIVSSLDDFVEAPEIRIGR